MVDAFIRWFMDGFWVYEENSEWHSVLLGLLDFISLLLIFLVFQLILSMLGDSWKKGNLNALESIVSVFTVILITVALYHTSKIALERGK